MIYQVRVNMLFNNEGIARGLYNHTLGGLPNAIVINQGQPNMEFSLTELLISNHELSPAQPSVLLEFDSNEPSPPL